jgi:hypothetical protein
VSLRGLPIWTPRRRAEAIPYEHILAGRGFGIADARPSIEMVASIRSAKIVPLSGDYHPTCKLVDAA